MLSWSGDGACQIVIVLNAPDFANLAWVEQGEQGEMENM